MAAVGHFGCPKFTFDRISGHFRSIRNFNYFGNFDKMAAVGHFGCPKFTFDRISGNFRSIRNSNFLKILTKWLPSAILDVRNSLSIAFLAILDQYATLIFLKSLTKWLPSAIMDVRNSLSIAFLAILDQYEILFFLEIFYKMAAGAHFGHFLQNGRRRPFWMSEIHFRSHFWPFNFTKWPPPDILDVRNSLLIAFLAISDRSAILDV